MNKNKLIFLALMLLTLLFVVFQIYKIRDTRDLAESQMIGKMHKDTREAAAKLDSNLNKLERTTEELEKLAYANLAKDQLEEQYWKIFKENKDLFGIGACYEPYAVYDSVKLYSPFYFRPDDQEKLMNLDEGDNGYDYTTHNDGKWYRSIKSGQVWQEPYFGKVAQAILAEYGVPIYKNQNKKEKAIGIVYADYSLNNIKEMMKALHFGETGYAYVISEKGVILSHPVEEYVKHGKTLREVADTQDDSGELLRFIEGIEKGTAKESEVYINDDAGTGQISWRVFAKIPTTNWTLVTIFPQDELGIDLNEIRRRYINISIGLVIFTLLLVLMRIYNKLSKKKVVWAYSTFFVITCMAATIMIYYFSINYTPHQAVKTTKILNNSTKDKFLDMHAPREKFHYKMPLMRVPSGIYVKSYEFLDANNVYLTGFVWQKYPLNERNDSILTPGFVFPEATSSSFTEAYVRDGKEHKTIGWNFEAKIRLPLNYAKFPFDNKTLNLRMWHHDFDKNIILTPDLNSYAYTNPTSHPGLEKTIVFGNWKVLSSFFNYMKQEYNTKFGLEKSNLATSDDKEEMNFTIVLERKFIGPLIANLLPFLCIVLIHFASIMNMKNENRSYVLGASSGLIFAVLIAHFSMRGSLNYAGIVYLEIFYFVAYFIIALSIINNSLYHSNRTLRILKFEENLVFRIAYWPIILLVLFIVTVTTFY